VLKYSPPHHFAPTERIFLRVPVELLATVIVEGKPRRKIVISDLSSTGLSFITADDKNIPAIFDLRFRLKLFSMPITVNAEVKHRTPAGRGVRIGCFLLKPDKKIQRSLNDYVNQLIDVTFADGFIFTAAFLCCVDVSWKTAARFLNEYYIGTEFGRGAGIYIPNPLSEAAFICYVILSFLTIFIIALRTPLKGKPRFIASVILLIAIFVYLFWKNISCLQYKLWDAGCLIAKAAFWWEMFLISCVAASIIICLISLKKINLTFKAIRTYTEGRSKRSK